MTVNGTPWQLLSSAATDHFAAQVVMTNWLLQTDEGEIPAGSISLTVSRMLGLGGLRETLAIRNHNRRTVMLVLAIRTQCDFADLFDVKSHRIVSRGRTASEWSPNEGRLETVHSNGTFRRGISIGPTQGAVVPALVDGALSFCIQLEPQQTWVTDLVYDAFDGDGQSHPSSAPFLNRRDCGQAEALGKWREQAPRLSTAHQGLQVLYDQSLEDLAALRLPIEGTDMTSFVPAAGIPWFAALFGRDALITAIQTVPIYPAFARGALEILARYQATETDDGRDMQPGKIPHELRKGELAELGLVPYRPYYGTADATVLYVILLHHTWRFTGDRSLLERHLETAERCLDWIDASGDMDGDGFQEYQLRSPAGAANQGWKDSGNGILDERGDDVPAPKALCELQGYVYDAWQRMAAVYDVLGASEKAEDLRARADDLHARFDAAFWDEDEQFYALCLDPQKRRVMSVTSNPGHLLWSGIVPQDRAAAVAKRLMADDMWSGWGVRTLSSAHPAYNPHDYQLGSVWPHDNGIIALGLAQYGFHDEAARIVEGMVDAGNRFELNRLPEVFGGTSRTDSPFPVQYLGANVPQAWAAGSVFMFLRAMLGLSIDVGASALYADPHLPDWLPELRLHDFGALDRKLDLRFWREGLETRMELLEAGPVLRLERRPLSHGLSGPTKPRS